MNGKNILMSDSDRSFVLGSKYYRYSIQEVIFLNTLKDKPADSWDVSADGSGDVQAWIKGATLYIAAEGTIKISNGNSLFMSYSQVKKIEFNQCVDTSSVTDMQNMFYGCRQLTQLDLRGFDTSNVEDMSGMFSCCDVLETLNISSFDTSKVTHMGWMFCYCYQLKMLDISKFNTKNVTSMNCMFSGCTNLKSLNVSGLNTVNVEDMSEMFSGCSSLEKLYLRDFKIPRGADVTDMFAEVDRCAIC